MGNGDSTEQELLVVVAHELRSPITVVAGLVDNLAKRRGEMSEAEVDDFLDRLRRQADRLFFLVSSLLDDSQTAVGRFKVALDPVDLAVVAKGALDDATSVHAEQSVDLVIPDDTWVIADPGRLNQVLVNLLDNAYRYGGSRVRLEAGPTPQGVLVTVADDGDGVPEDLVEHLFQRFSRGANASAIPGSGLGLALSRELVEAFGGRMWYEASELGGASFNFTLSAAAEDADPGASSRPHATGGGAMIKILVVEDEPDVRFLLRTLLEAEGYEVLEAHHGAVALERIKDWKPDVVVTDVMMPIMDGNELIRRLRSDPTTAAIPVLAVTARSRPPEDADAHLTKPFLPDAVLEAVAALTRGDSHGPA